MLIHTHVNHKPPRLLRQNPKWRVCQPPLAPTVAIPVASLTGSSWVGSPVFFPPCLPLCGLCVWFLVVVCLFLFWFVLFIFLGRTLWMGAGGEGLRRFPSVLDAPAFYQPLPSMLLILPG